MRIRWHVAPYQDRWCLREGDVGGTITMPFPTREAAEAELERWRQNGLCVECGDPLNDHWIEDVKARVLSEQTCHGCLHWRDLWEGRANPNHLVVDGRHYVIGPVRPPGYRGFLGFGGRRFHIRFHDGREVVTHNLWTQGVVPREWRDRLPDTAEFLRPATPSNSPTEPSEPTP